MKKVIGKALSTFILEDNNDWCRRWDSSMNGGGNWSMLLDPNFDGFRNPVIILKKKKNKYL
jgi:hypothetical protein